MVELLFDDVFKVERMNPDGKKFDKVTRIEAKSEKFDMFMHLDICSEIYPVREGEKFSMALAPTLNFDGTPDTGYYLQGNRKSLADKYEYVMQGKLYRISEGSGYGGKAEIDASFGGLLMMLKGDPSHCTKFELDQRLFLLIRKNSNLVMMMDDAKDALRSSKWEICKIKSNNRSLTVVFNSTQLLFNSLHFPVDQDQDKNCLKR